MAKNYRYSFTDKDVVVSPQEHEAILEHIKQERKLIILRGGKLVLNTDMMRYSVETDEMTATEEAKRDAYAALPIEERMVKSLPGESNASPAKVKDLLEQLKKAPFGAEYRKPCETCKEVHYIIPGQMDCLTCRFRKGEFSE